MQQTGVDQDVHHYKEIGILLTKKIKESNESSIPYLWTRQCSPFL
jgi:hypothetical protein